MRPPWAIDEILFIEICTGCGECITQCPTHIIRHGRADFPVIDFTAGECLFCGECVSACKPGALLKTTSSEPWSVRAAIKQDACISYRGVECRGCYDPCETGAISMRPQAGGITVPLLDTSNCSGCGACYSVCPVSAIAMNKH